MATPPTYTFTYTNVTTTLDIPSQPSDDFTLEYTSDNLNPDPYINYKLGLPNGTKIDGTRNYPFALGASISFSENWYPHNLYNDGTQLYITSFDDNLLYIKSLNNNDEPIAVSGIPLNGPMNLIKYGNFLYIGNYGSSNILKIELDGNNTLVSSVLFVALEAPPSDLHLIGDMLYVLLANRTLVKFDLNDGNAIVSTITIFTTTTGFYLGGIASNNNYLYITDNTATGNNPQLVKFNITDDTFSGISLSGNSLANPRYIVFFNNVLYVTNAIATTGYISMITSTDEFDNGTVTNIITGLNNPIGITIDMNDYGPHYYVACYNNKTVNAYILGSPVTVTFTGIPNAQFTNNTFNSLDIYNASNLENPIETFSINVSCYIEGTKILCLENEKEVYLPIETLRKNSVVKTYLHGYKKIRNIGKGTMINNSKIWNKCVYKMNKTDNMLDDLFVTGWHAILEDNISDTEFAKNQELKIFGKNLLKVDDKFIVTNSLKIDDKFAVPAGMSDKFIQLTDTNIYTYYHFTLESNDIYQRFGVYANGVLSESTSINNYEKKNFINL